MEDEEFEESLEEFDYQTYMRTSDNNMPNFVTFVPLSEEEQAEAEQALQLS